MTARAFGARLAVLAAGAAGLAPVGCSSMNNTEKGTLIGAGAGSVAGALIGKATGNPKTGAVVGALGGGLVGGLVGNDADRKEQKQADVRQAVAEQAYRDDQPARIAQIVELTRTGQSENVILNYIKTNSMTFRLSLDDLNTLKANNVSPRVIEAMQLSAQPVIAARPRPVVVEREVIVERPVPVYGPPVMYGPPAAGVVFVGGRRW